VSERAGGAPGHVRVELADRVAVVTLDRPPVNALSSGFYEEIGDALGRIGADQAVSVAVLRSASQRAFCAGADVTELAALSGADAEQADTRRQLLARPSRSSTARRSARARSSPPAPTCEWARRGPASRCQRWRSGAAAAAGT